METLFFSKGRVNKLDNSVVLVEFEKGKAIEVNDLEEEEIKIKNLLGNNPYSSISILPSNFRKFSMSSRDFIIDENHLLDYRKLDCYIASSIAQRIELELFFQLYKPHRKTKIFSSINKALVWINNYKEIKAEQKKMSALV